MRTRIRNYSGRNFKKKLSRDKLTKKLRSGLMSKIRSKETKFEREFILRLKKSTRKKFKVNVTSIKGKPDIVFEKHKVCVFLDSDFWHGWQYPRWKHLLKDDFWREKIKNNRNRDKKTTLYLKKHGWTVVRIWGHQLNANLNTTINKIVSFLY
ncbi:MAG: DUF559 domain-containing protein [Patescibacteria group bacterium]